MPFVVVAQKEQRTVLHGQIVSDSLAVENITVLNKTSAMSSITDKDGNFSIYARAADTLYFSAVALRDAQMVLKPKDFSLEKLIVRLDAEINMLDEIVVHSLTGNLAVDSRRTKIKNYTPAIDSGEIIRQMKNEIQIPGDDELLNNALPQTESSLQGINFNKIGRMIFRSRHKNNPAPAVYKSPKVFTVVVRERFSDSFFIETLKIPEDEIIQFIAFCDIGENGTALLDPQRDADLTNYLIVKSAEYLKGGK